MIRIIPSIKNYDWGQKGEVSLVRYLCSSFDTTPNHTSTSYAEMWLGSHPSGPSKVHSIDSTKTVNTLLTESSEWSEGLVNGELPFLMKILSIESPLSIQTHPSLELAKELHKKYPNLYPDSNHKPEVAVALTPFEALCGFRHIDDILTIFSSFSDCECLFGDNYSKVKDRTATLKDIVTQLLTAAPAIVSSCLTALVNYLSCPDITSSLPTLEKSTAELLVRLHEYYPGDVGCLMACVLHHVKLAPGDAIFIPALSPHAYIFGDCVESMACSDNVIRGGLTPKAKHVEILIEELDYSRMGDDAVVTLKPHIDGDFVIFSPPVTEFKIIFQFIQASKPSYSPTAIQGPAVGVILQGHGSTQDSFGELHRGDCIMTPPNSSVSINALPAPPHSDEADRILIPYPRQVTTAMEKTSDKYYNRTVVSKGGLQVLQNIKRVEASLDANFGWGGDCQELVNRQHDMVIAWTLTNE